MLGLHQGSVLSTLLFAVVMDVVSSEARSGPPSELLYVDDLILIGPTMEQLGRLVVEWRVSLLNKGLKMNTGKSKVMVGSSGGKMIVTLENGPVMTKFILKIKTSFETHKRYIYVELI